MQDLSAVLDLLRCPRTGERLRLQGDALLAAEGGDGRYPLTADGIPIFAAELESEDARRQRDHFERVAEAYTTSLESPQTQEYLRFHDRLLVNEIREPIGTLVELCCGRGEAVRIEGLSFARTVGVDVSEAILSIGRRSLEDPRVTLVQADALHTPLAEGCADAVLLLGGIHHVPDRVGLYTEVRRLLRPGGYLYWREPVDDFLLWRGLRQVIYRLSPSLDWETEAPLRHDQTRDQLARAGLDPVSWRTTGFLAWCVLANSDVLVFNRALRYVPGIRRLARLGIRVDEWMLTLPGLERAGTQVIGVARRP